MEDVELERLQKVDRRRRLRDCLWSVFVPQVGVGELGRFALRHSVLWAALLLYSLLGGVLFYTTEGHAEAEARRVLSKNASSHPPSLDRQAHAQSMAIDSGWGPQLELCQQRILQVS